MEWVQILMSTYNGEKYLRQQLDSILNQTYPNIRILVRDDGSKDGTLRILKSYAEQYHNISYYQGDNKGVIGSFFDLLKNSDDNAAFYGLADQDDDWLPDKVARAVELLERSKEHIPLLYCSDTYIADENLNIIKSDNKNPRPSWGNALVQNICTGCTAVLNRYLRDIVKDIKPEHIIMHDWWLYLAAELFGEVCYDRNAYIKYRQHGHNVYGAKKNRLEVWSYRLKQLGEKRGALYPQLEEIKKWYPDMDQEKEKMLSLVLSTQKGLKNKIKLILNKKIYRNDRMDDLVYRGIVLIGKL